MSTERLLKLFSVPVMLSLGTGSESSSFWLSSILRVLNFLSLHHFATCELLFFGAQQQFTFFVVPLSRFESLLAIFSLLAPGTSTRSHYDLRVAVRVETRRECFF